MMVKQTKREIFPNFRGIRYKLRRLNSAHGPIHSRNEMKWTRDLEPEPPKI